MAPVAHRLIGYGVVTCLAGILFSMVATQLVGLLYEALPPQTVIAGAIIEFVNTVIGVCLAPLGTALIGIAPVQWTPRKGGCSSWEVNVGSSVLRTRTRP